MKLTTKILLILLSFPLLILMIYNVIALWVIYVDMCINFEIMYAITAVVHILFIIVILLIFKFISKRYM